MTYDTTKFVELRNDDGDYVFKSSFLTSMNNLFGDEIFSDNIYTILKEYLNTLSDLEYHLWYNDTNGDITKNMIVKNIMKNYKTFNDFHGRWSINNGFDLSDEITRDTNGWGHNNIDNTTTNTGERHDTNGGTTGVSGTETTTDNRTITNKSGTENSPIGTTYDSSITTPDSKIQSSEVRSGDVVVKPATTTTIENQAVSNYDETTTSNMTNENSYGDNLIEKRKNGVEILKSLMLFNKTIVDVIADICNDLCFEYRMVL